MNATEWIKTTSCCQGHSRKTPRLPYVEFYCKASEILKLAIVLNEVDDVFSEIGAPFMMDCTMLFSEEIATNAIDAELGWAAFCIGPIELGEEFRMNKVDKEIFIDATMKAFIDSL
jgi:hypothetical protein